MFFERKKIEKKLFILSLAAFVLGVCIGIEFFSGKHSMKISEDGVSEIFIGLTLSSTEISASGSATIESEQEIKKVVDILNSIRVKRGNYSVKDLEGHSPHARINFFDDENEKINYIYFYYDIILYNGEYYGVNITQYKKLIGLCKKYGEVYSEEYN